jgi:ribosomal-protein-alanine N-acetyltransferase
MHLFPASDQPLRSDALAELLEELADNGIETVRTSALSPIEAAAFIAHDFTVAGRLALLYSTLVRAPRARTPDLRRGRQRDHDQLLALDRRCFPELWRFDRALLVDALEATPITRFRVAADLEPLGYAITGVAGTASYLQRLAVDPSRQRRGLGRRLVDDARQWASRRGATTMLVNTAVDNTPALRFYEELGFARRSTDLCVMERRLDA